MWAFSNFNFSSYFCKEAIDFFSSLSLFSKSLIFVFLNLSVVGGIGGEDLKLGEEVIAVLGEWGCFLQGWDLVDCCHEKEWVIAALGEWGCFLQAWSSHSGQLGHHLWEEASDLGEWGFHLCVNQLRINFTGFNGHVIWGRGVSSSSSGSHFFFFFFSFCFSSVFLSRLQKHPFSSCKNNFGLFYKFFGFPSHNPFHFF